MSGIAELACKHVRETLAGFKVPRLIEFVAELPRNASGEVPRHGAQR